ncbi:hypothetical protein G5I_14396 [Acromyrmex echinatior]|uniref:Uncharacterized protein n=1 Tax=Acromyrmex echinatior TaxID=103372 RepID=F4X7L4_ACREC|nr:hypothetical protein G5I_14396 [Acromyrmex echinatior]
MRAAWREGQKDAPLCPVGCKRNLLSGYAVPAVLTVAKTKTATVAKQALSCRIDKIREFRGGAGSRNGNCTPESRLLFHAPSRFAPQEESLYERKRWGRSGEDKKKGRSQERKLERIFELEPPKRN